MTQPSDSSTPARTSAGGTAEPVASRPARRRQFSLEDKRAALLVIARYGGNLTRASRQLGIHASVLGRWRDEAAGKKRS